MEILEENKKSLSKALFVLAIILCVYFAAKIITEVKNYNNIPEGTTATNTISFDGTGEVSAAPDLATISLTIDESSATVKDAQNKVTAKETAVLAFLDKNGIAKKDIKTDSYNSYPKYEYRSAVCPQYAPMPTSAPSSGSGAVSSMPIYCPPGKSVLTGYETSENISVKIHDLSKAGDMMTGIGAIGISNISGPNFSIENQDQLKEQARQIAINDAKTKAKTLAKDLGVHLVRIINFSENGNYPMQIYSMGMTKTESANAPAPAPALPTGENKITSNVTITYEIR
jgi:uncharacterized protein